MGSRQAPPSAHRLPTVSAAEALRQLRESGSQTIPTGIPELDGLLVGSALSTYGRGGFVRGQLTEIFGPPGSGKTAFGVQAAARALDDGNGVVWIDAAQRLGRQRVLDALGPLQSDAIKRLCPYFAPTVAHLLALIHRPQTSFMPSKTSLLVIDDVSLLFPPQHARRGQKTPATAKTSGHRLQLAVVNALCRIAGTHNVAVLLLNHVGTKFRPGSGAFLVPAQDSREWDDGFASRLGLFRDFAPPNQGNARTTTNDGGLGREQGGLLGRMRFAGIVKAHGLAAVQHETFQNVVAFGLTTNGKLVPVIHDQMPPQLRASPVKSRKRRFDEVPDTEDDWSDSIDEYSFDEDHAGVVAEDGTVSKRTRVHVDATPTPG